MRQLALIFLLILSLSAVSYAQVNETGKADISRSITLYPNPALDFINIKSTALNFRQNKLVIYNILGNEIQAETEIIDDHEVRIRVKELSTGYYLIAVRDEQTQFRGTYKFLKR